MLLRLHYVLEMLVFHCHVSFGSTTDVLKNVRSAADWGTAILSVLQQFLCTVHSWSIQQIFYSPRGKYCGVFAPYKNGWATETAVLNTCTDNGTAGLCKPFLGYGSINTFPRRRNDVTLTVLAGSHVTSLCDATLELGFLCSQCEGAKMKWLAVNRQSLSNSGSWVSSVEFQMQSVPNEKWMQWQFQFMAVTSE
jgi:hypothetical protein